MIVGFAGRKGAGKDTAARVFEAHGWVHLKMADGLKAMLHALLAYQGVDDELVYRMLEGDLKETPSPYLGGHTPRHAMQTLGTEWGRQHMGENFWVNIFLNAAREHPDVVCSDVRFHNEVAAIQEVAGQVFRIDRRGAAAGDVHASEAHIDELDVDGVISNRHDSAEAFAIEVNMLMGPGYRS